MKDNLLKKTNLKLLDFFEMEHLKIWFEKLGIEGRKKKDLNIQMEKGSCR